MAAADLGSSPGRASAPRAYRGWACRLAPLALSALGGCYGRTWWTGAFLGIPATTATVPFKPPTDSLRTQRPTPFRLAPTQHGISSFCKAEFYLRKMAILEMLRRR